MSQPDPDAPNTGNLRQAFANMADYVRQHERGNLPSQKKEAEKDKPQNICRVCDAPFNHSKIAVTKPILTEPCRSCSDKLAHGYTALRDGSRYAFVIMPERSADLRGMILDVSKEVLDEVEKQKNEKQTVKASARSAESGEPCDHAGCLSHINHPCEGCGRIGGRGFYLGTDEAGIYKNEK